MLPLASPCKRAVFRDLSDDIFANSFNLELNLDVKRASLPKDFTVRALQTESLIKLPTYFSNFYDFWAKLLTNAILIALVTTRRGANAKTINVNFHE